MPERRCEKLAVGFLFVLAVAGLAAPTAAGSFPEPPAELSFSAQKPFFPHDGSVGALATVVPGAAQEEEEVVGTITNSDGDLAKVTVAKGEVIIESVKEPGKYSGTVNLNPGVEAGKGPKTKITLDVRDSWGWALIALLVGLLIAILSELWLTRWRPRGQLEKQFTRLEASLDKTATRKTEQLGAIKSGWAAPRIQGDGSLLVSVRNRIEIGLENAESDEERKRFGPGGEEVKKVETLIETYEDLLGYSLQIGQSYVVLAARLDPDSRQAEFEGGALSGRISELLRSTVISHGAELTDLEAEAKDLHAVLHSVSQLDESYRRLAEKPGGSEAIKDKIEKRRKQLLHDDLTDDDVKAQHDLYAEIAKELYEGEGAKAVQMKVGNLAALSLAGTGSATAASATPRPLSIAPPIAPIVLDSPENGNPWKKYFEPGNWAYSIVSGGVVIAAGLSALYFSNSTFGSTEDYIGMVLWGSTVQGGISLVRQLIPGRIQSLTASR